MSGIEEIPAGYQGLRTGQEALLVSPCCPDPALIVRGRPASLPYHVRRGARDRHAYTLITMLLCPVKDFFGFGEELGDLFGEVLGAGARQADGGDDASVVSAEPDEPGSPGWSAPGARGAGVDLDGDGWHAWSLSGRGRGCCWPGCRGCGQDREGPLQGEGKLLLGHAGSWQAGEAGDGRRIVRRPAGAAADLRVRPSPGGGR